MNSVVFIYNEFVFDLLITPQEGEHYEEKALSQTIGLFFVMPNLR